MNDMSMTIWYKWYAHGWGGVTCQWQWGMDVMSMKLYISDEEYGWYFNENEAWIIC